MAPACGNGVVEAGETCDGPTCVLDCDDGELCTDDVVTGSAAACNVRCEHTSHPDGSVCGLQESGRVCMAGKCSGGPMCGNGEVDKGEICDGTCPAMCPDSGNLCNPNRLISSGACQIRCQPVFAPMGSPCGAGVCDGSGKCSQ